MTNKLLIGSANQDKARELTSLLAGLDCEVCSLADLTDVDAPEENGSTFADNALLKATFYSKHFGLPCVADDSGLCVDALNGAPGVYSARYAGEGCSYADNNEKLLDALAPYLWHERTARFVCCAAFVAPAEDAEATVHVEEGTVEGYIAMEAYGKNGFGYDPVFVPKGSDVTFAEMTAAEKHTISHRGRAFDKMAAFLRERYAAV